MLVAISDLDHEKDEKFAQELNKSPTGFAYFALGAPVAILLVLGMYMK